MDALATGHDAAAQMINTCTNLFRADGQFRHSRHAQIARRVNPSHAGGIAEDHKSASHFPRPASPRGAARDRHETRGGMRWTLAHAEDESVELWTVKSCGPDAPTLAPSWRKKFRR